MKILCDADFIVYKSCAAAETEIDWGDDTILVTSKFSDAYAATRRELAKLEKKYSGFDGLNLTFETLDGILKHNGPIKSKVPEYI